jgi:cytochrome c biogenesis protein CcdA
MRPTSPQQALWHLARFGFAARQSLRLRVALMQAEARDRGRHARYGVALMILGLIFGSSGLLIGLGAVVMLLVSYDYSPQAALGLVAGGAAILSLILLVLGRNALARAVSPRR